MLQGCWVLLLTFIQFYSMIYNCIFLLTHMDFLCSLLLELHLARVACKKAENAPKYTTTNMSFHKVPRNYTFMLLFRSIYPGTSHDGGKTVGTSPPLTRGPLPSPRLVPGISLFCLLGLISACLFGFGTGHLLIQLGLFWLCPFVALKSGILCQFWILMVVFLLWAVARPKTKLPRILPYYTSNRTRSTRTSQQSPLCLSTSPVFTSIFI